MKMEPNPDPEIGKGQRKEKKEKKENRKEIVLSRVLFAMGRGERREEEPKMPISRTFIHC
jgi:hypothetical protein